MGRVVVVVLVVMLAACGSRVLWKGHTPDRRHAIEIVENGGAQWVTVDGKRRGAYRSIAAWSIASSSVPAVLASTGSTSAAATTVPSDPTATPSSLEATASAATTATATTTPGATTTSGTASNARTTPPSRRTEAHVAYAAKHGASWVVVDRGVPSPAWDGIGEIVVEGARTAYSAERAGKWHVVVDGKVGPAWPEILAGTLRFSAGGSRVVYAARDPRALHGIGTRVVVDGVAERAWSGIGQLVLSQDGNHVAYAARLGENAQVVVDGVAGTKYLAIAKLTLVGATPIYAAESDATATTAPTNTAPTSTAAPSTTPPSTAAPNTASPSIVPTNTVPPDTAGSTTLPNTAAPSTPPNTAAPNTATPSTTPPNTAAPNTASPSIVPTNTVPPNTAGSTAPPSTVPPNTTPPNTAAPNTAAPSTTPPNTAAPNTIPPSTASASTAPPSGWRIVVGATESAPFRDVGALVISDERAAFVVRVDNADDAIGCVDLRAPQAFAFFRVGRVVEDTLVWLPRTAAACPCAVAYALHENDGRMRFVRGAKSFVHDEIGHVVAAVDRESVAYTARRGELWDVLLDGQASRGGQEVSAPVFGRGGRFGYVAARGRHRVVVVDGREHGFDTIFEDTLAFASDGSRWAVVAGDIARERLFFAIGGAPGQLVARVPLGLSEIYSAAATRSQTGLVLQQRDGQLQQWSAAEAEKARP